MKYLLLSIAIAALPRYEVLAQTFSPQFIGSAGARGVSVTTGSLEWTVGEAVVGTATAAAAPVYFTQGFHQPWLDVTPVSEQGNAAEIAVFPNPANHLLHVNASSPVRYQLYNAEGKQFFRQTEPSLQHQMSVAHLPSGMYLLRVEQEDGTPLVFRVAVVCGH